MANDKQKLKRKRDEDKTGLVHTRRGVKGKGGSKNARREKKQIKTGCVQGKNLKGKTGKKKKASATLPNRIASHAYHGCMEIQYTQNYTELKLKNEPSMTSR